MHEDKCVFRMLLAKIQKSIKLDLRAKRILFHEQKMRKKKLRENWVGVVLDEGD